MTPLKADPPNNIEAEQALLGAILIDNRAMDGVANIVTAQQFYDPVHQQIFETMARMIEAGRVANPVTVKPMFETAAPINDHLTIPQYLGRLATHATTTRHAPDYARTVRDLAVRRDLIQVALALTLDATDAPVDANVTTMISDVETQLYALAEPAQYGGGSKSIGNVLGAVLDEVQAAYSSNSQFRGLATGFSDLDAKLGGLAPGNLIILAGRPAMGKSALAVNIGVRIAKAGSPVQIDSLEMSATELGARIMADQTDTELSAMRRGTVSEQQMRTMVQASHRMANWPLYIDDVGGLTISRLAARARRIKRQRGMSCLIIDYLQLMAGTGNNRVSDVTDITTGLKTLAKELDIPIIALSQLSRKCEERTDKRPLLSDLRDSGSIEQDADMVLFVYRDAYYIERDKPAETAPTYSEWDTKMRLAHGKAEVIVAKHRHGPTGTVHLAFDAKFTRFNDLARETHQTSRRYG